MHPPGEPVECKPTCSKNQQCITLPGTRGVCHVAGQRLSERTFLIVEAAGAGMREIAALVESGRPRPQIDTVMPFEKAAEADRLGQSGRVAAKIVLTVD